MKLAVLKNPYLVPGVAGLTRPGPFPNPQALLVRKRGRRNPNYVGWLDVGRVRLAQGALGGLAGYALDTQALRRLPFWAHAGVCAGSGLLGHVPLFGAAAGGALWYGLFDRYIKQVALESTAAFFGSMR